MIAIVFGATGLVGKELVYEILADQRFVRVRIFVRKKLPLSHSKLEQIVVKDFQELDSYRLQLEADAYFCCIGTTIRKAGSREAFKRVDLDIPLKIASFAHSLKVPNLVILSSIGANAGSSNFYLRTKGEMEEQVQRLYDGNLKFVRPSLLLGHRSEFRFGERLSQVLLKIFGFLFIGGLAKYRGIYSWDVAKGMIKSTELPKDIMVIESDEIQRLAGQLKTKIQEHQVIK